MIFGYAHYYACTLLSTTFTYVVGMATEGVEVTLTVRLIRSFEYRNIKVGHHSVASEIHIIIDIIYPWSSSIQCRHIFLSFVACVRCPTYTDFVYDTCYCGDPPGLFITCITVFGVEKCPSLDDSQ